MKKQLTVGMPVFFVGEDLPMIIKAISERFAIVTRDFDKKEDEGILEYAVDTDAYGSIEEAFESYKTEVVYSILDFKENRKAPNNQLFNGYDYRDMVEIHECLADLESGDVALSQRHGVDLHIDWDKTLNHVIENSFELELERAKKLKGKKLSKNEIFLVKQFWEDENFILHLYSNEHGIGYKHITEGGK